MSLISYGLSFDITSEYLGVSSEIFEKKEEITIYVEGVPDVAFWNSIFKLPVSVNVIAFGLRHKSNGKGAIIESIKSQAIKLGKNLLVALDSDYDYILDKNSDIFASEFVFQTYSYSIENLLWHPVRLGDTCKTAANCTHSIDGNEIERVIKSWSNAIYPEFLRFLFAGARDGHVLEALITEFRFDDDRFSFDYSELKYPEFTEQSFIKELSEKGLTNDNVYLFVQGHLFEDIIEKFCQNIVGFALEQIKTELKITHPDNFGQMIAEYYNSRSEPRSIVKNGTIVCDVCMPKISNDIEKFKQSYLL